MVVSKGVCRCVREPRDGEHGLEGYALGEENRFERCDRDRYGRRYVRVYPGEGTYYETCGPGTFLKFFEVVREGPP